MGREKINIDNYSQKFLYEHNKDFSYEFVLSKVRYEQVLKSLNKYEHENILEVGCGLNPMFQSCRYKNYTIVEPCDEFVRRAEKLAEGKANINIIHGYIEEVYEKLLQSQMHRFDFIILSSILHEVPNPAKLLESIYYLCSRDTVVHINVPNVYSFHRLLAHEAGYIKSIFEQSEMEAKFQRHTRFDQRLLFKIVEECGFQILSYGTYFIKPFNNEQMEKMINQNIVGKDIIEGLERMIKYMPDLGCEMFVDVKIKASDLQ